MPFSLLPFSVSSVVNGFYLGVVNKQKIVLTTERYAALGSRRRPEGMKNNFLVLAQW